MGGGGLTASVLSTSLYSTCLQLILAAYYDMLANRGWVRERSGQREVGSEGGQVRGRSGQREVRSEGEGARRNLTVGLVHTLRLTHLPVHVMTRSVVRAISDIFTTRKPSMLQTAKHISFYRHIL